MDKIRVVLAEDHSIVRQGTRNLLEREPDIAVVAEASNGREAVQAVQETMPDVVVLDVAMPEMTGIEATRIIKHLHPRVNILVLTAYDDDEYVFAFMDAGAAGYLLKDVPSDELDLTPVNDTAGKVQTGRSERGGEMPRKGHTPEQILNKLRQVEVAVANGKQVAQAVRDIGVSDHTYYRWRTEYGGLNLDQAKKLKQLERENARLKRAVAELTLDKLILKEAAEGNF